MSDFFTEREQLGRLPDVPSITEFAPETEDAEEDIPGVDDLDTMLLRAAGQSVQELDRAIGALQSMREEIAYQCERVRRQAVEYAAFSQSTMQSTKEISDGLRSGLSMERS